MSSRHFLKLSQLTRSMDKLAAAPVMLGEDVLSWPQEVTSEVFRAMPFLDGMDVRVELVKSDPDSGVGVGRVEVRNSPLRMGMARPDGLVALPFVVRGFELSPLDIATDGEVYFPASQKNIERILSRPNSAAVGPNESDLVTDSSYFRDLNPPDRTFGGVLGGGGVKLGGARTILDVALSSAYSKDVVKLASCLDEAEVNALTSYAKTSVDKLASYDGPGVSVVDIKELLKSAGPSVVQIKKMSSHRVKVSYANHNAFVKVSETVPMEGVREELPEEAMEQVDNGEAYTMGTVAPVVVPQLPNFSANTPIAKTGTYTCFAEDGSQVTGWATPNVHFLERELGVENDLVLFSNGVATAMQPQIAGVEVGSGFLPPTSVSPSGMGFFVMSYDGDVHAYGPYMIQSSASMPNGAIVYNCVNAQYNVPVIVTPVAGIERPAPMGEGMVGIPDAVRWVSANAQMKLLMPSEIVKSASIGAGEPNLYITSPNKGRFTLDGPAVAKLASAELRYLDKDSTEFMLTACGLHPDMTSHFLKEASNKMGGTVPVRGVRTLVPFGEVYSRYTNKVKTAMSASPPSRAMAKHAARVAFCLSSLDQERMRDDFSDMFRTKVAAQMESQETVDSILSLGLINPNNVAVFVRQKPELEKALSTLCTLLLYARLGAPGVPEISLEQTVKGFEETLDSLEMMPFNVSE